MPVGRRQLRRSSARVVLILTSARSRRAAEISSGNEASEASTSAASPSASSYRSCARNSQASSSLTSARRSTSRALAVGRRWTTARSSSIRRIASMKSPFAAAASPACEWRRARIKMSSASSHGSQGLNESPVKTDSAEFRWRSASAAAPHASASFIFARCGRARRGTRPSCVSSKNTPWAVSWPSPSAWALCAASTACFSASVMPHPPPVSSSEDALLRSWTAAWPPAATSRARGRICFFFIGMMP
mmetsp:Transcript_88716/g.253541  ORF Transcript_88716/g.253541 Transcript_88716/m.253541 type:complete len:247 (-) Transcript_88716:248-988(-)